LTAGDDTVVRRYADAMRRRGFQMVLRRLTYVAGGAPNPPILSGAVLDGAVLAGATTITIRADQADGRLLAGDTLTIAGATVAIAAMVTARPAGPDPAVPVTPGFDAVALATPLVAGAADGTPLILAWSADDLVWVTEAAFSLTLASDQILAGDLHITMAAFGVAEPSHLDQLIAADRSFVRSIVTVGRAMARGQTVAWQIQAR
jgi:hypothetical protein